MHETQNYQLSKIPSAYEKQFCFTFPNDLFSVQVSTKFDLKEELFRNYGGLLRPYTLSVLAHSWGDGQAFTATCTFVWIDPAYNVAASYDIPIKADQVRILLNWIKT